MSVERVNLSRGSWTPTLTGVANIDATTAFTCYYMRIGDWVRCWGKVNIDPTAAGGTLTQVGVSLPVATTMTDVGDLQGVCAALDVQRAGVIDGDVANQRARLRFFSEITANTTFTFNFDYRVM